MYFLACKIFKYCVPCTPPPPPTLRDTVGQCADGTHSTGMHSCIFCTMCSNSGFVSVFVRIDVISIANVEDRSSLV